MPLKIVKTPDDPHNSRKVVYVPDPVDRPERPRPEGRMYIDPVTGRWKLREVVRPDRQFFVGLDLGQSNDYTAIVVVEKTADRLAVPHLARTRHRPYPDIVASVMNLMARPELAG